MIRNLSPTPNGRVSPFERIKHTNEAGNEYWSSREFAAILGYSDYRNFEAVIEKARMACLNSGHRIEDHFADVSKMVAIGSGAERPVKTTLLSRYACYLIIQNADPGKEIVAHGKMGTIIGHASCPPWLKHHRRCNSS
jgi:DNA-damage-inducible protein D